MYELNHAHKDSEILSALSVIRYSGFSPKIHTIKIFVIGEKKDFAYSDHRRMKMVDKEMLAAMEDLLDRKLDEKLDEKLKPINIKLDNLETSVKKLDERTSKLEISVENLEDRMEKLDERTSKLEADMTYVKVVQLENNVIPRLNTIEKCYIDTSERYLQRTEQMDRMDIDINILKQVVANHSEQLKKAQ